MSTASYYPNAKEIFETFSNTSSKGKYRSLSIRTRRFDRGITIVTHKPGDAGQIEHIDLSIPPDIKLASGTSWLLNARRKLNSFRQLKAGWNSYDAEPPNGIAIHAAQNIIRILYQLNLKPTRIVASAEGGVAITFFEDDLYSDIECLNSGEILAVTSDSIERPQTWVVTPDHERIKQTAERIREFFDSKSSR